MARRVNTKFLVILTCIIIGLLGSMLVAKKLNLLNGDPDKLKAEGKVALEAGHFDDAMKAFGNALRSRENDIELRMLMGETFMRQWKQTNDMESFKNAVAWWNRVLQIDPKYVPALQNIVNAEMSLIRGGARSAELYAAAITSSGQLLAAQPEDAGAQKLIPMLTLQGWMTGIATNDQDLSDARQVLTKYLETNPSDSEIIDTLGQSILWGVRQSRDAAQIAKSVKDVMDLVDRTLAATKDDASVKFRCSGLIRSAVGFMPVDQRPAAMARAKQLILESAATVKDDNQDLADIYLNAVNVLFGDNKAEEGIKYLDSLLAKLPERQTVRLMCGRQYALLGTKYRLKALALLEKPIGTDNLPGQDPHALEVTTRMDRISLRVDLSSDEGVDPKARKEQIAKAREEYASLTKLINEQLPDMLRLLGRIELAEGNQIASAIQHLEAANTLLRNANQRNPQLMIVLAKAYASAGQNGKARDLLKEVGDIAPSYVPAKVDLAQLYLSEQNTREANRVIDEIAAIEPKEPRLLGLKLRALRQENKTEQMVALLNSLPETEMPQILGKARASMELGLFNEAERLMKLAVAKDPNDEGVQRSMIDLYLNTNRRPQAIALLEEFIKKHPDDKILQSMRDQLMADSPAESLELQKAAAEALTDPFEKAMALGQIALQSGNAAEAIKQFEQASKLKTDSTQPLERLFVAYLTANQPEKAEALLDPLIKANTDQAHGLVLNFRLAMFRRDYPKALALATRMTNEMPEFSQSWLSLGQGLQGTGDYQNAIDKYQRAIQLQPTNETAYRGVIECYYQLQNPVDARRTIEKAISVMPNRPIFKEMLLLWKQGYGNPEEALPARREAAKAQPEDRDTLARLAQNLQQAAAYHFNHGDQPGSKPLLEEATKVLKGAIAKWPDDLALYVMLRDVYLQNSMPKEAEATVLSLRNLESMRNSPDVDVLLADLYARQGLTDQAEQAFRKAIFKAKEAKAPNIADLQVKLSQYLASNGHPDSALASLPSDSKEPTIQVEKARLLMIMDKLGEAQSLLETLVKENPESMEGQSLMGFVCLLQRKYPEAETALNQALKLAPDNTMALLSRARVYMLRPKSDLKAAIRDLVAARAADSTNTDVRLTLAGAYRQQNDISSAVSELMAVSSLQPTNKTARMNLVQLFNSARPPRLLELDKLLRDTLAMPAFAKDPDFIMALANMQQRTNPDRALETLQASIKESPNNIALYRGYMDVLMNAKRYKDMLDQSVSMASDPSKAPWWIYQLRGQALQRLDRRADALKELDKGLSTPDAKKSIALENALIMTIGQEIDATEAINRIGDRFHTDPYWQMVGARIYMKHNLYSKAIEAITEAEKSYDKLPDEQKADFLRLAAEIYTNARPEPQPEKARDYNLKLLNLLPNDLAALNNLAFILVDNLNQPEQALIYSQQAMDQMTSQGIDEPLVRDTQGWVLVHMPTRYEEGMSILKSVAEKQKTAEVYVHLGRGYLIGQDYAMAEGMFKRAEQSMQDDAALGLTVDPLLRTAIDKARIELSAAKAGAQ